MIAWMRPHAKIIIAAFTLIFLAADKDDKAKKQPDTTGFPQKLSWSVLKDDDAQKEWRDSTGRLSIMWNQEIPVYRLLLIDNGLRTEHPAHPEDFLSLEEAKDFAQTWVNTQKAWKNWFSESASQSKSRAAAQADILAGKADGSPTTWVQIRNKQEWRGASGYWIVESQRPHGFKALRTVNGQRKMIDPKSSLYKSHKAAADAAFKDFESRSRTKATE